MECSGGNQDADLRQGYVAEIVEHAPTLLSNHAPIPLARVCETCYEVSILKSLFRYPIDTGNRFTRLVTSGLTAGEKTFTTLYERNSVREKSNERVSCGTNVDD